MKGLQPAADAEAAAWVVAGLRRFAESVLSVVPAGFPAYVRVFHPAYCMVERQMTPMRWSDIAAATGIDCRSDLVNPFVERPS